MQRNFSYICTAHRCAGRLNVWVWVYWCFTTHATIFQSYMWRHSCASGMKKLYLLSCSQRHRHFEGFFNVPVLQRHGTTLFIRWFRHTAQFSCLSRHAGDTEEVFSTETPGVLTGGRRIEEVIWKLKSSCLSYRHTAPLRRLLPHARDMEDVFSTLNHRRPHVGFRYTET